MAEDRKRPVGVHSLDHFSMEVPDLDEAAKFYAAFGLDTERMPDRLLLRTFGSDHVHTVLTQGPRKRLTSLHFSMYEEDFATFAEQLAGKGVTPASANSNSIWVETPDGLKVEVAAGPKTSRQGKMAYAEAARFEQHRGAHLRSGVGVIQPLRLVHLSLFTRSVPDSIAFYTDVLGMRLSDRVNDDVAFIHAVHGSDHHLIALGRSDGPGLHHCSWEVGSINEIGQGAAQMEAAGYGAGWGLGRHVLGSNYFRYVRDPWGSYSEYAADMDYIPEDLEWVPGNHKDEDSFYQWGPPPPEDFATNHETAPLAA